MHFFKCPQPPVLVVANAREPIALPTKSFGREDDSRFLARIFKISRLGSSSPEDLRDRVGMIFSADRLQHQLDRRCSHCLLQHDNEVKVLVQFRLFGAALSLFVRLRPPNPSMNESCNGLSLSRENDGQANLFYR